MTEESTGAESAEQAPSDAVAEALSQVEPAEVDPVAVAEALSQVEPAEVDPVAELTALLQRRQAEYENYRKRVDKERIEFAEVVIENVLTQLLGALDDIDRAQEHGELTGGFKAVADQLVNTTAKLGLTKFVDIGVTFNPHIHEALMHETSPEVSDTQVTKILRPGYKFKERILRPAQVIVTDPE